MTLQQLEYMVALDTHRHFVTAAEKCFVTQPTLTIQLKKLEEEMGVAIFDRSKHPIEPTEIGAKIILKARTILREVKGVDELIQNENQALEGTFKVGIIPTLAPYLLPRFLRSFGEEYPRTRLIIQELESEVLIDQLMHDELDIAIMSTPLKEPVLREVKLFNEPFVVYAAAEHPLDQLTQISSKDLLRNDLWLLKEGHCFRNQTLNVCGASDAEKQIHFESGSLESIKYLVDTNGGFSLFPALTIDYLVDAKEVLSFKEDVPVREIGLVVHHGFAKEALLNALHDTILAAIPDSFEKMERYVRVKWR